MVDPIIPQSPVLVSGANGFIGTALCRYLTSLGCQVRAFILTGTSRDSLQGLPLDVFEGDICRSDSIEDALVGVKTVFHLAALATDWAPMEVFLRVNVTGTRNMLSQAKAARVERFVHMSSLAIHPFSGHVDGDEDTRVGNLTSGYCTTKAMAEDLVHTARDGDWFETTIIRPGAIIFGPRDLTAFVHLAPVLESGFMPLPGGGQQLTCYSCVDNLVAGMALAAAHPKGAGQTFILTDDVRITMHEYLEDVCQALGARTRFLGIPVPISLAAGWLLENVFQAFDIRSAPPLTSYRAGLVAKDFHFSCARAKQILGYSPSIGRREGLDRMVSWYRDYQKDRS